MADNTAHAKADEVAVANNAILHLFNRIVYQLSNQLIESLNYPSQATTVLGLLKYPDDFSTAQGLNQQQQQQLKLIIMDLLQGMHNSSSHQPSKVHSLLEFR